MKLPNFKNAVIETTKLTEYLLNVKHKRGGDKAKLLQRLGYSLKNWQQLKADIQYYHLDKDVDTVKETSYGRRYEISASLQTPTGESRLFRTVWQIDKGVDFPRLITLIPD